MINARMETVTTKPAYRRLIPRAQRRALQIADGYFEWLKPEKRSEPRQPFFFQVDGGVPFAFAALWTPARVDGEWIHSVALLTCDAAPNRVAAAIHDRMPVILADRDAQQAWLDPRSAPRKRSNCAVRWRASASRRGRRIRPSTVPASLSSRAPSCCSRRADAVYSPVSQRRGFSTKIVL